MAPDIPSDVGAAVLADIVGSRALEDRARAQTAVLDALRRATEGLDLRRPPWSTVGDEFQVVLATLEDAVVYTGRVHLLLPHELGLRFGIGVGQVLHLDATGRDGAPLEDGPAWWAARDAIEQAHRLQDAGNASARTWMVEGRDHTDLEDPDEGRARGQVDVDAAWVNSLLAVRDHVIFRMKARERRIAGRLLMGQTQVDIAREEDVVQSAVSQSVHRSGAAELAQIQRMLLDAAPDRSVGGVR